MRSQSYDIFLSYARIDQERVRPLADALKSLKLKVFFDEHELLGGDDFSVAIDQAVKTAKVVVGCWTKAALSRRWVVQECRVGLARGVLVPLAFENISDLDVPVEFFGLQVVSMEGNLPMQSPLFLSLIDSVAARISDPELPIRAKRKVDENSKEVRLTMSVEQMGTCLRSVNPDMPRPLLDAFISMASGTEFEEAIKRIRETRNRNYEALDAEINTIRNRRRDAWNDKALNRSAQKQFAEELKLLRDQLNDSSDRHYFLTNMPIKTSYQEAGQDERDELKVWKLRILERELRWSIMLLKERIDYPGWDRIFGFDS